MPRYTPGQVTTLSSLATELTKIKQSMDSTLSRDTAASNAMTVDLDMNSNQILNLPKPVQPTEPVRVQDVNDVINSLSGIGADIISETEPFLRVPGLRWYNPSIPATFVYYVDGDSGQWVEQAAQAVDGGLRSDLSSVVSSVVIAGQEAARYRTSPSFISIAPSAAALNSIFVDNTDNLLKFKDINGTVRALVNP